ncbi:hypothetical protein Pfo_000601 [Paulownia fortunei]|nr:hypothetical protein Pfo_000601 [Paulownia fortunei]
MPSGHDMSRYNVHENDWGRDHLNVVYDMPNRYVMPTYYAHQDDRGHFVNMQHGSSYYSREDYWGGRHVDAQYDHQLPSGSSFATAGVGGGRAQIPLPPGDCNALFVEGLPAECVHGEKYLVSFLIYSLFCFPLLVFFPSLRFADMFRPFLGYKDVRLIRRESRQPGGEPVNLCFAEFFSPAHAAAAMHALQGYKFDMHESNSAHLRLQFSRNRDGQPGSGHHLYIVCKQLSLHSCSFYDPIRNPIYCFIPVKSLCHMKTDFQLTLLSGVV